jgi:hypothetical protein
VIKREHILAEQGTRESEGGEVLGGQEAREARYTREARV